MELTPSYTQKATFSRLRSLLTQPIVQFVNQNPEVFEAISRTGAPFGGTCLPTGQYETELTTALPTEQELVLMQQQLNELTEQVAQLTNKLNATQPASQERVLDTTRKSTADATKQIGIYRFWALQGKEQTMA